MSHGIHTRVHALTLLRGGRHTTRRRTSTTKIDTVPDARTHGPIDTVRYRVRVLFGMFECMRWKVCKICYLEFEHFEFVRSAVGWPMRCAHLEYEPKEDCYSEDQGG